MTLKEICKSIDGFNNIKDYFVKERVVNDSLMVRAHLVFTICDNKHNNIDDFFIDDIDSNFESNAKFIKNVFREFNISEEIAERATTTTEYLFDGDMHFVGGYFVEQYGKEVPRKLYAQAFYDYE